MKFHYVTVLINSVRWEESFGPSLESQGRDVHWRPVILGKEEGRYQLMALPCFVVLF